MSSDSLLARRPAAAASAGRQRPRPVEALLLVLALAVSLLVVHAFAGRPYEDAAMLLRYAQNMADGAGVVYNVGDHPVDGATDFLFMVLVAVLRAAGVGLVAAARLLDVLGAVGTCLLVYVWGVRHTDAPRWVSASAGLLLAVGPAAFYTRAGFGAPFFGCTVALTAVAAHRLAAAPDRRAGVLFGSAALVMGLTRPEGVLIAAALAVAVALTAPGARRDLLRGGAGVFVGLGLVYFLGRWAYFGQPLPNPYYKKGSGSLHPGGLLLSVQSIVGWLGPLLVVYALPLKDRRQEWRPVVFAVLPAGVFTAAWLLLSPETNYLGRFQYPVLVLAALELPAMWAATRRAWRPNPRLARRAAAAGAAALLLSAVGLVRANVSTDYVNHNGNAEVGRALSRFPHRTLATTEAGLLPLASGWRSVDIWGLNDQHIARTGRLDTAYLDQQRPTVVMMHVHPGDGRDGLRVAGYGQAWYDMCVTVRRYVKAHGYTAAASYGNSDDVWEFWVDAEQPDAQQIVSAIRAVQYRPPDAG